jgi:hypothetical protein
LDRKGFFYRPEESIPTNEEGSQLLPLAQFYLPEFPVYSPLLRATRVLTLFMCETIPEPFEKMGNNWLIREYGFDEIIVRKDLANSRAQLKPFPLKAELVNEDYPLWGGGGVPSDITDEILLLENDGRIECYYDIVEHVYAHKFDGYPSFCQSGVHPSDDFEFVFQISSDAKVRLNVVDSGSLMFWKNARTGEWLLYYDFY